MKNEGNFDSRAKSYGVSKTKRTANCGLSELFKKQNGQTGSTLRRFRQVDQNVVDRTQSRLCAKRSAPSS
jgi:hypothetical protein